jgi:1-acyl-sn-glycerol-3-phosphate acyltransferase
MMAAGYISIDREGTRETVEAMNKAARKIHDGMSVVIFPEGSRSPDGTIQPFKKGGFSLAVKSNVPIVPVALSGSRKIMPRGKWVANSGVIRVRLDAPIETENCSAKDRERLMEKVREAITRNFDLISKA